MYENNLNLDKLKFIQKQFLCAVPISKFNWDNIFVNLDWELQKILISLTVNLDLVLRYPIKQNYQLYFLKHIINQLEKQGSYPSDCLYNALGRLVTLPNKTECFKHYLLRSGKIISLKENINLISEGTTGLCSWEAAVALSEWSLRNRELFKNKRVLELGSGIGLTGLTVALNCEPKEIYLTDCHPSVLKLLDTNIKINGSSHTNIHVLNLPWENIDKNTEVPEINLLLAADVIYDSSLFFCFLNAITTFFKDKGTRKLIIACTERNKNTLEEFCQLLGEKCTKHFLNQSSDLLENNNFVYEEVEAGVQENFIWSTDSPVKILIVTKKASSKHTDPHYKNFYSFVLSLLSVQPSNPYIEPKIHSTGPFLV